MKAGPRRDSLRPRIPACSFALLRRRQRLNRETRRQGGAHPLASNRLPRGALRKCFAFPSEIRVSLPGSREWRTRRVVPSFTLPNRVHTASTGDGAAPPAIDAAGKDVGTVWIAPAGRMRDSILRAKRAAFWERPRGARSKTKQDPSSSPGLPVPFSLSSASPNELADGTSPIPALARDAPVHTNPWRTELTKQTTAWLTAGTLRGGTLGG